jgi:hypothetical protein
VVWCTPTPRSQEEEEEEEEERGWRPPAIPSLYDLDVKWIGTAVALLAISIGGVAWALAHQDHSNNQPLQPFG